MDASLNVETIQIKNEFNILNLYIVGKRVGFEKRGYMNNVRNKLF